MRYLKYMALLAVLALPLSYSQAQVSVGIGIGPGYVAAGPPVCTYGYYDYYPYACAPYGYYGPDYFVNGIFIGAGPWYHWGHPAEFWGHSRFYGRPGWGYRGGYARGYVGRGYVDRGFHGERNFRGGERFRGGESFHGSVGHTGGGFHGGGGHGGGGFHGGGGHGGGRR